MFDLRDRLIWGVSALAVVLAFVVFDGKDWLLLCASLVGVTSLIFNARGYAVGQALMVVFSCLYGIISYRFAYYGEMATYLGMTGPMALAALISWIRHPYKGGRQVEVNRIGRLEICLMFVVAVPVTVVFWFILSALGTANIVPSTVSVTTSFIAVYLTFRRSEFFALAYAANDVVLIVLWVLAALESSQYWSVAVCFVAFLFNDFYGFIRWRRMRVLQGAA